MAHLNCHPLCFIFANLQQQQQQQSAPKRRKRTHTRGAEGVAKLDTKGIKSQEVYFDKRWKGRLGHQDIKKGMCSEGGFKLKIQNKMTEPEVDAVLAATPNDLAKRFKVDWDWHRTDGHKV